MQRSADLSSTRRSVLISGYLGIGGGQGEGWGLVVRGRGGRVGGTRSSQSNREWYITGPATRLIARSFSSAAPCNSPAPRSVLCYPRLQTVNCPPRKYICPYTYLYPLRQRTHISSTRDCECFPLHSQSPAPPPFLYVLPHPWTIYRITGDKTVNGSLFTRLSRDYTPSLWAWLYPAPGHAKRRNPRWSDHGVFKQQHSSWCSSPRQRFVDRDENWSKAVACCRSEELVHRLSGSHSGKPTWGSVGDFLFVATPAESYRTMADLWGGWTSQSKFIVRTEALILERRSVVWEEAGSSPSLDIRIMDVITLGAEHPHGLHFHVRTVAGAVVCVLGVASRNSHLNSTNITRVSEIT